MATKTKKNKRPKVAVRKLRVMTAEEIAGLLPTGQLDDSSHDAPLTDLNEDGQLCLMEAVAYIRGEPHSDHPRCADPALTEVGIEFNDNSNYDSDRNDLIAAIPALVGSRTGSKLVRWKRAKKAAQLFLAKALDGLEDEFSESASLALIEKLKSNRVRTRADAEEAYEALAILNDGMTVSTEAMSAAESALEVLTKYWNPAGISQKASDGAINPDTGQLHEVFEESTERVEFLRAIGNIRS